VRSLVITIVLAGGAAVGCSKSPTGNAGATACSVTLSGSVTGTYDCTPALTVWASAGDTGSFSFQVANSGSQPSVVVSVWWMGQPATGRYTNAGGSEGAMSVGTSSAQSWYATAGTGSTAGTYDLDLTSVTNAVGSSTGESYTSHGSLTASLVALAPGTTGTVTLSATF